MSQIYTLKDIDNSNGTKLGEKPFNWYPPNRAELEEQLSRANKDQERVLEAANQLIDKYDILDEENKCIRGELDQAQKENEHIQEILVNQRKTIMLWTMKSSASSIPWIKPSQKETISSIRSP